MSRLKEHNRLGFTIVELLIVIVVIAILAAISMVAYNGIQARALDSARSSDISSIQKALTIYHEDRGGYPICGSTEPSVPPANSYGTATVCLTAALVPKYITKLPTDPKNTGSYQYWYAVGYKKQGATTFTGTNGDDYMIGYKNDTISSPVYTAWGASDLTALVGSS